MGVSKSLTLFELKLCTNYRCLGGAAVGRRTSDLAVVGSIPGPGVIRHLGQLSLPSFRVRKWSLHQLGLRQGVLAYVALQVKL